MWCFHKPDFEALLIAELQRQQQCSQFCDTVLKAEGLSVPAHSCILSAISPQFSSSLSSTPVPPTGQNRLLEFRGLGGCSLLHMVQLLYSGEMAGEGEREKQEAISAAARLGIHGLVEVTQKEQKCRKAKDGGQYKEVGVQTEMVILEEADTRQGRWRREMRDGSTLLWRDASPSSGRETWTQTEEQSAPACHPSTSFDTIDMNTLQSLTRTDSHLVLPPIPYIPVSLVYTPDETPALASSFSSASAVAQPPPAAGHGPVLSEVLPSDPPPIYPFPSPAPQSAPCPQTRWSGSHATVAGEGLDDEAFEKIEDNISGFINYFLNSEKEEKGSRGRQPGRGPGSKGRGTAETRAKSPRVRRRGRGRLMQTVDVQEVKVSTVANMFPQRWGVQPSRTTGQGGGVVGRKLCVKTREDLLSGRNIRRGRPRKVQDFSGVGNIQPKFVTGRANRRTVQRWRKDDPPVPGAQRGGAKSSSSPSGSTPVHFHNPNSLSLSTQLPLCRTSPPLAAPPPHEYQPEYIERLLEEVMFGLDILPSNNEQSQPSLLYSSDTYPQNKHQISTTQGAAAAGDSANCDMPVLQQQTEGELCDILDHFLQSLEGQSCAASEEESDGPSSKEPNAGPSKHKKNKIQLTSHIPPADPPSHSAAKASQITERQQNEETGIPPKHSQTSADCGVAPTLPDAPGRVNRPAKRRKRNASVDKQTVKVKKPALSSDGRKKHHHLLDKQLQQMPVVKLERNGPLPANITLQKHSYEDSALTSSLAKHPGAAGLEKSHKVLKSYALRIRCRKEHALGSIPLLEELPPPTRQKYPRRGRPRNNGHLPRLSDGDVSRARGERCEGRQTENEDRCGNHGDELTVQPQEEDGEPARRGRKRRKEADNEEDEDVRSMKSFCPESQPVLPSPQHDCEAAETQEIDVETVSNRGDPPPRNEPEISGADGEENPAESHTDEDTESGSDEIIDVVGESSDKDDDIDVERFCLLTGAAGGLSCFSEVEPLVGLTLEETSPDSTGSLTDERGDDIDVIGRTDCSEGEGEIDVDTDYTSTLV